MFLWTQFFIQSNFVLHLFFILWVAFEILDMKIECQSDSIVRLISIKLAMNLDYKYSAATEEIIESISKLQRKTHGERGAWCPQTTLTFALCIGTFACGNILNWSGAYVEHMKELTFKVQRPHGDYAWLICAAPLGISVGILIWGFLVARIGPKNTILSQTPLIILSLYLQAYCTTYKVYYIGHFLAAFCSAGYLYAGEFYLLQCVHRKNLKIFFAFFRSFLILGVFCMNFLATFLNRLWLCIACGNIIMVIFAIIVVLPDSPYFLLKTNENKAVDSLKYYMGKEAIGSELNLVKQQVNFLNYASNSEKHMLSSKVVFRAFIIITFVHFFKICTGYYAFILDSIRIFQNTTVVLSPFVDNIIFGVVMFVTNLIGCFAHLYGNFGIRKPMMISMILCSAVLCTLGVIDFLTKRKLYEPMNGTELIILSVFAFCYDIGMNFCPEMMLYSYVPYQIYDYMKKTMMILQWILIFLVSRFYMECKLHWGLYVTLWILTAVTVIGFIFITTFTVDIRGKSLMTIQLELGGNPIGTRGSTRQRQANPFESVEETYSLQKLIATDIATSTRKVQLLSDK